MSVINAWVSANSSSALTHAEEVARYGDISSFVIYIRVQRVRVHDGINCLVELKIFFKNSTVQSMDIDIYNSWTQFLSLIVMLVCSIFLTIDGTSLGHDYGWYDDDASSFLCWCANESGDTYPFIPYDLWSSISENKQEVEELLGYTRCWIWGLGYTCCFVCGVTTY